MEYKDYYQVLGVERGATDKEIKRAYRQLARKFHPDVNPDDARADERFRMVRQAYEALANSWRGRGDGAWLGGESWPEAAFPFPSFSRPCNSNTPPPVNDHMRVPLTGW